jgi:uncharacterized protein YigA (DUF484 family)
MTSSGKPQATVVDGPSVQHVVDFLRNHPSFLDDHPELLSELSIPHASGEAISLMQRQVAVLRNDNNRLKEQLEGLVGFARQNENLNARIHTLVLTLMNAVGPQAIFARLEQCLREDFGADRVAARVFAEPAFVDSGDVPQFVGSESAAREPFDALIVADRTVCGAIGDAQRQSLFTDLDETASAVVMPLLGKRWDGVLVIASHDGERYQADMGTEFLTYLKDVVALVVDPWVKPPRDL